MNSNTTATTGPAGSITLDDLLESMKGIKWRGVEPWRDPSPHLFGLRVHVVEPKIVPKMKLSDRVPLPDDFRREFDAWLLEQFGTIDLTAQKRGEFLMSQTYGFVTVRREDYALMVRAAAA